MKRKPTRCAICNHREHAAVDLALARGVSVRALARRYKVSTDSLYRHGGKNGHLPKQLRAALVAGPSIENLDLDRLREVESQSLLSHLVNLRNRLFASLDVAEECGDSAMVARVAAQLHSNFELVAKLLGDLATGSTNITNILVAPQYVEMRVSLVRAYLFKKDSINKGSHQEGLEAEFSGTAPGNFRDSIKDFPHLP